MRQNNELMQEQAWFMIDSSIDENYTKFYGSKQYVKVYPTEFVVRIFLSNYPELNFNKPKTEDSILDVGFGDGRNTSFLCDLSLDVSGIELSRQIVRMAKERLQNLGHTPDLRVGRNSRIPYDNDTFDYILACHSCYYCHEEKTIADNIKEYARVPKTGGFLIASVPDIQSYIFDKSCKLPDGTSKIVSDPYGNRVGYRLHSFETISEIKNCFSPLFTNFSFGRARNDYFGLDARVFWVVWVVC
jgi:SAM-dependent methyltransferase